jgi:hypothetical protein
MHPYPVAIRSFLQILQKTSTNSCLMDSVDLRITFSQLDRFSTRLQSRADRNNAFYAGLLRSEQYVVEIFRKNACYFGDRTLVP